MSTVWLCSCKKEGEKITFDDFVKNLDMSPGFLYAVALISFWIGIFCGVMTFLPGSLLFMLIAGTSYIIAMNKKQLNKNPNFLEVK